MRTLPSFLLALVLAGLLAGCASPREATVPVPPSEALTRAERILESFEYNVVEVDREAGLVRGLRTAEHLTSETSGVGSSDPDTSREVIWEVTVHVSRAGEGTLYRLEGRTLGDLPGLERVDSGHMNRILAALTEWRR